MMITPIHPEGELQIGGGNGWVATQVRTATERAQQALLAAQQDWNVNPGVVPHPREAAIAAAREAVLHLNEALHVEAPEDAVMDTRHALEALTATIKRLENLDNRQPLTPIAKPLGDFEHAINLLIAAERKLTTATWGLEAAPIPIMPNPNEPRILGFGGTTPPLAGPDPDEPTILGGTNPPLAGPNPDEPRILGGTTPPIAGPDPDEPTILGNDNGGIVPPWLQ